MEDQSPSSESRKCSAVTGSGRKLKDNAADWHNLILRWEKLNNEGSGVAEKIVDQRLKRSPGEAAAPPPGSAPPARGRPLEQACSELVGVVSKMASIVAKMERLASSERGVLELETFQRGAAGRGGPLFHGWPTQLFVEQSAGLLQCYQKELALKQRVLQELAHTGPQDLCMVYLSCWLHQPYVPADSRLALEALLLETGHRAL
ncbi:cyclin-dependent kinase 2-interacting protein isoform X2 [Gadus chalcogrammus]|uniref:cyclin-dependent kinase 2-interacting protein isoform X2 n=1 Tax=Gadus chalcogrammus TaxID=1042646 RepID=UPI0024C29298|nr:cyclin-dependent kinase 2-interacting protein isoform X2 [Gadus chalcogrammus]